MSDTYDNSDTHILPATGRVPTHQVQECNVFDVHHTNSMPSINNTGYVSPSSVASYSTSYTVDDASNYPADDESSTITFRYPHKKEPVNAVYLFMICFGFMLVAGAIIAMGILIGLVAL